MDSQGDWHMVELKTTANMSVRNVSPQVAFLTQHAKGSVADSIQIDQPQDMKCSSTEAIEQWTYGRTDCGLHRTSTLVHRFLTERSSQVLQVCADPYSGGGQCCPLLGKTMQTEKAALLTC